MVVEPYPTASRALINASFNCAMNPFVRVAITFGRPIFINIDDARVGRCLTNDVAGPVRRIRIRPDIKGTPVFGGASVVCISLRNG